MNKPLAVLCALILTATACGKEKQDSNKAMAASPTPSGSPRATAPPKAGGLVLTPVAPGVPVPRPTVSGRPRSAPSSQPAPGGPPAAALTPPDPGTYTFDETGVTRVRGCLSVDQPAPTPTRMRVDPAAGNRQHFERTQTDALGGGAVTVADLEYRPDGVYVAYLRQVQTLLLQSIPAEFEPNPPSLAVPSNPSPGQSWSFTLVSKDGKITLEADNRVEAAREQVTIGGGASLEAIKIATTARVTGQSAQGSLDLTRTQSTWFSPEKRLQVKEITDTKGRIGLCEIDGHIEAVLRG